MAHKKDNSYRHLENPLVRVTDTHIYFLKGILSNWYPSPRPFSGKRALERCMPQLDALEIAHPTEDAVSTRLIKSFVFGRGEQWMMALKAWIFERDSFPLGDSVVKASDKPGSFDELRKEMLSVKPPQSTGSKKELWGSALCRILRTNSPKSQKMLGRKVPNFDDEVWTKASEPIVVAGCLARAEFDRDLKGLYLSSGERTFVEGSARDRVWGVGLDWKSEEILDEVNWRGLNRLGKAHNEAARILKGEE
ncbi:hypothetical protein BJY04DRAFT_69942 [Aspergillus karnatakaensis]|uniref:NADAR family protein n=1 Tax=Aspergillus karnatakaensis TaxID=1810916 RepID=UPI003CCE3759